MRGRAIGDSSDVLRIVLLTDEKIAILSDM